MTTIEELPTSRQTVPWAKDRILETANRLFYSDGIRTVGVDRLITASSVTKATFYKHYGSKDTLIETYIRNRHEMQRDALSKIVDAAGAPEAAIRAVVRHTNDLIAEPDFRGCPFINAASDFPEPTHPVRLVVTHHRDWGTDMFAGLLHALGHPMPGDGADELMLAFDGALSGGYAGDPIAATTALARTVERVLAEAA